MKVIERCCQDRFDRVEYRPRADSNKDAALRSDNRGRFAWGATQDGASKLSSDDSSSNEPPP
jgi:hypothetical protein